MTLPPINIIHDAKWTERDTLLKREITEHNLEVIFWPAIYDPMIPFRGVARAHKQIIADAKEKNLPFVVVAEDDLLFTAKGAYEYYIEKMPPEFDLYLASVYFGHLSKENTVRDFAGLTLYTCHNKFYDTFLATQENDNLDRKLAGRGTYYVCNPFTCIQHSGYSILKRGFKDYSPQLKGRRLYGL